MAWSLKSSLEARCKIYASPLSIMKRPALLHSFVRNAIAHWTFKYRGPKRKCLFSFAQIRVKQPRRCHFCMLDPKDRAFVLIQVLYCIESLSWTIDNHQDENDHATLKRFHNSSVESLSRHFLLSTGQSTMNSLHETYLTSQGYGNKMTATA